MERNAPAANKFRQVRAIHTAVEVDVDPGVTEGAEYGLAGGAGEAVLAELIDPTVLGAEDEVLHPERSCQSVEIPAGVCRQAVNRREAVHHRRGVCCEASLKCGQAVFEKQPAA